MKVVFITNYMTHHQLPFCLELYKLLGDEFTFIATNVMEDERKNMGWGSSVEDYPFIHVFQDYVYDELIETADVLLCGGTDTVYIRNRLKDSSKLTFRYFESLYKTGRIHAFRPRGYRKKLKEHTAFRNNPVYLLCAGAYVPGDFNLFFAYPDKMYKWGYFTQSSTDSYEEICSKKSDELTLLWTGRMIDWKHPTDAVRAFRKLCDAGMAHKMIMIGEGPERANVEELLGKYGLSDKVELHDFMRPDEVREYMKRSHIYLMTSDRQEGWGAVVNEAMDSGMIVVGSNKAGSVPYLIDSGVNGFIYKSGNIDSLTKAIISGIESMKSSNSIGRSAYDTLHDLWSPEQAAKRFLDLSEKLMAGEAFFYDDGPLSKAENMG